MKKLLILSLALLPLSACGESADKTMVKKELIKVCLEDRENTLKDCECITNRLMKVLDKVGFNDFSKLAYMDGRRIMREIESKLEYVPNLEKIAKDIPNCNLK